MNVCNFHSNKFNIFLPAQGFCIKWFVISMVDDDNIMVFGEETFQSGLRVSGNIAFVTTFLRRPPEPVTLVILLREHQQYLKCNTTN